MSGAKAQSKKTLSCQIDNKNISDVLALNLDEIMTFLKTITQPLVKDLIRELNNKIQALIDLGLSYLTLNRSTDTLSGGEVQRIKIAKFMNSALVDMLYILDEPSVGLHPHDIELIKKKPSSSFVIVAIPLSLLNTIPY